MSSISGGGVTVNFDVVTAETPNYTGTVTSAPIEGGQSVNDHYTFEMPTFQIQGVIVSGSASKENSLVSFMENGTLCSYKGRSFATTCVVTRFQPNYTSQNKNGFSFTLTLQQIRLSETQTFTYKTTLSAGQSAAQTSSVSNVGTTSGTSTAKDTASIGAAAAAAAVAAASFQSSARAGALAGATAGLG